MKAKSPLSQTSSLGRFLNAFVLAVLLGCPWAASAQVTYTTAVFPDNPVSGSGSLTSVLNTGCDATSFAEGFPQVFCWDGNSPSLSIANLTVPLLGTGGTITDPDVALDAASHYHDQKSNIIVTYLINGDVYYEVRQYSNVTHAMSTVVGATKINTTGTGQCSNPNVDTGYDGFAVITWEQAGNIYARAYKLLTAGPNTLYPVFKVTGNTTGTNFTYSQPDVSVNYNTNNNTNTPTVVSFVYLATNPTTGVQTVNMRQLPITTVRTGSATSTITGFVVYNGSGSLANPRISAPWNYAGSGSFDYSVVLTDRGASSGNQIINLNKWSGGAGSSAVSATNQPSSTTVLNSYDNLDSKAINEFPVVTYAGDAIIATWVLVDGGSFLSTRNGNKEVLQVRLNYTTGAVETTGYLVLNKSEDGNQFAPSVAGRNLSYTFQDANGCPTSNSALYAWYDEKQKDVFTKFLDYTTNPLRPAGGKNVQSGGASSSAAALQQPNAGALSASSLTAYPNPFHGAVALDLGLAEGEQVRSLAVYSPTGQLVTTLPVPVTSSATFDAAAAGLKPGLYLLRLATSQRTQSLRLQVE